MKVIKINETPHFRDRIGPRLHANVMRFGEERLFLLGPSDRSYYFSLKTFEEKVQGRICLQNTVFYSVVYF